VVSRTRAGVYARRRKRRLAGVAHDLTDGQWQQLKAAWGGCAYCGAVTDQLQKDCVLPIAHGGRYTLANVVPACRRCNASKCDSEVTTWMRSRGLDEPAFLIRRTQILQLLAQGSDKDAAS